MIEERDDTFLARWLNDELTEEELRDFQNDPDYAKYQKIVKGTEAIRAETFDEEAFLKKVRSAKQISPSDKTKVRQLWTYGIAAAVALLIGFYVLINWETTMEAGYGSQLAFNLPDDSEVILNANSKATYRKRGWEDSRKVSLQGEAFFKVNRGSTFTVLTDAGEVTVLGTQFNVRYFGKLFEVTCYEGKVEVKGSQMEPQLLLPGKTYRKVAGKVSLFEEPGEQHPGWIAGESTFRSMPVRFVLTALENQFDIEFQGKPENSSLLFSGSFPHDDLEVALKIVLGSLQIDYTREGQTVILESKS